MPDLGVPPVVVVTVHELVDPGAQLVEVREGVPVVVLVFEDAPKRFRGGVVVAGAGATHGPEQSHHVTLLDDILDDILGDELTATIGIEHHAGGSDAAE